MSYVCPYCGAKDSTRCKKLPADDPAKPNTLAQLQSARAVGCRVAHYLDQRLDPDRPTVPEAAEALRAYYALPYRGHGGAVHIITEDFNTSQSAADGCLEYAETWGREWGHGTHLEDDVRIARMLASMSSTQRGKLAKMSFYPCH